jgi:quercetin dioxygenase-like cupin family protein
VGKRGHPGDGVSIVRRTSGRRGLSNDHQKSEERPGGAPVGNLNETIARFDEVIARHSGEASYGERLVETELVMGTFIYQSPGQGNRRHYHATENEFWVILKGSLKWEFDDETVVANAGDVVLAKANRWHRITVVGDEPSVRFAVVKTDVLHIYE